MRPGLADRPPGNEPVGRTEKHRPVPVESADACESNEQGGFLHISEVAGSPGGPAATRKPAPDTGSRPPWWGVARIAPLFLIGAVWLAAASLLFSTPPGATPDEGAHYLRALGAGRGQVVLDDVALAEPPVPDTPQEVWMRLQAGEVVLPEKYDTWPFECWAHLQYVGDCSSQQPLDSEEPAAFYTYVGTYPPYAYLLPGLLMRASGDATTALMLGRVATALLSLSFLSVAAVALFDPKSRLSLIGLIATLTPMVLLIAVSLSSSGVEIASGIAFVACLLRLARTGAPRWVWYAASVSGATLALVRDLGPAWVVADLAVVAVCWGPRHLRSVWSSAGRPAKVFAAALTGSFLGSFIWRAAEAVGPDLARLKPPRIDAELIGGLIRQSIGVFGPLDTVMPGFAYRIWEAMVVLIVGSALYYGVNRQRAALVLSILATAAVCVVLQAVQQVYGFGLQTRHLLPLVVVTPLIAGEIVYRSRRPGWMRSPVVPGLLVAAAGVVHLTAWFTVGRRFAVGSGGRNLFFVTPAWSPPGGWIIWGAVTAAATVLLLLPFFVPPTKELSH